MGRATGDLAPPPSPARDDRTIERWTSRELHERFVRYTRTRDRTLRNELIEAHRPLAVTLARRYDGRGEPLDDLVQTGMLGLLKAVERYDPERGVRFTTFAIPTILGTLKRHFRDTTWAVKVPRRPQELHARIRAAVETFSQRQGRQPTVAELAAELGAAEDDVLDALQVGASYRTLGLDTTQPDDSRPQAGDRYLGVDESGFAAMELRRDLEELLTRLPERQRIVVRLRFVEDMTQAEIAHIVGVSQMQISRLLRRSLEEMRAHAGELLDA
jgi:RNA polymerase sigma-B factor